MSIIPKLATSLNRRDEVPNQGLAVKIVNRSDSVAVSELVENLSSKNKGIRNDAHLPHKSTADVRALPMINADTRDRFIKLLSSRLDEIEKESGRKRIEKVIEKVG